MADNEFNMSDLIIIGGWLQKNTLFDFSSENKNCPMTQHVDSSDRIASGASARAARCLKERGSVRWESRTYLRLAGRDRRSADCATWAAERGRRSADCATWAAERGRRSADCATWAAGFGRRSAECATRLSRTHHAKAPSLSRQPRTKNQELLFPNTPP
jgi:hypothetical protein